MIRHAEGDLDEWVRLGNKFPMILKTSIGSTGVGVMFVESAKALVSIVQLLYRENKYIDILLQEFIKTDYDVRVVVLKNRVMGAMKRPIVDDFRSNVSQGSEPEIHELTDLEKLENTLKSAEAVGGDVVGVDFIPSKNREEDSPYFIGNNSNPGPNWN